MPKVSKGPKRFCSYCNRERSLKLFTKSSDICNFCFYFDKAAALTAPKEVLEQ